MLAHLLEAGYPLGAVTGNLEAAAHIKMHRARLKRFLSFGDYGSDSTGHGELTKIVLSRAILVLSSIREQREYRSDSKP